MKKSLYILIILSFTLIISCIKVNPWTGEFPIDKGGQKDNNNQVKIAVVSDIHYMASSLLKNNAASGKAFLAYLDQDPKLLEYSEPIFRKCISQIIADRPDILLIPGDLTKDGEKVSHQEMRNLLMQFDNAHIRVFVIPGNHDINNPEAAQYDGNTATQAPTITPNEFIGYYGGYGYTNALDRDPRSLSYVSQVNSGLWIMGLDACEYENNTNIAIVAGRLKPETIQWALSWIAEAKKRKILLLGMMHHGILEHYTGQNQLDPGYVVDDNEMIAQEFNQAGLAFMFTGHYHANDITSRADGDKILNDIETGSLVTPPSPYRIITLKKGSMDINTEYITAISTPLPGGLNFPTYSNIFLSNHLDGYIGYAISNPPYSLPAELVGIGAPLLRDGFMAHYAGDEKIKPVEQEQVDAFGQIVPPLGDAINSLWTDLIPADNNLHIKFPVN